MRSRKLNIKLKLLFYNQGFEGIRNIFECIGILINIQEMFFFSLSIFEYSSNILNIQGIKLNIQALSMNNQEISLNFQG